MILRMNDHNIEEFMFCQVSGVRSQSGTPEDVSGVRKERGFMAIFFDDPFFSFCSTDLLIVINVCMNILIKIVTYDFMSYKTHIR